MPARHWRLYGSGQVWRRPRGSQNCSGQKIHGAQQPSSDGKEGEVQLFLMIFVSFFAFLQEAGSWINSEFKKDG